MPGLPFSVPYSYESQKVSWGGKPLVNSLQSDRLSPSRPSEGLSPCSRAQEAPVFPEAHARSALLMADTLKLSEGRAGFVFSRPQKSTSIVRAGLVAKHALLCPGQSRRKSQGPKYRHASFYRPSLYCPLQTLWFLV